MDDTRTYDDGRIACGPAGLTIRWYYPWGQKTIPYESIAAVNPRPITTWFGKWRIWGTGDLVHWYNLDPGRPNKDLAVEIVTGGRVRPTITPDDPQAVMDIVRSHLS